MPARPWRALRIDPALGTRRRIRRTGQMPVLRIADGRSDSRNLTGDAQLGTSALAPGGLQFAFSADSGDGMAVWLTDAQTGEAHVVPGLQICGPALNNTAPGFKPIVGPEEENRPLHADHRDMADGTTRLIASLERAERRLFARPLQERDHALRSASARRCCRCTNLSVGRRGLLWPAARFENAAWRPQYSWPDVPQRG